MKLSAIAMVALVLAMASAAAPGTTATTAGGRPSGTRTAAPRSTGCGAASAEAATRLVVGAQTFLFEPPGRAPGLEASSAGPTGAATARRLVLTLQPPAGAGRLLAGPEIVVPMLAAVRNSLLVGSLDGLFTGAVRYGSTEVTVIGAAADDGQPVPVAAFGIATASPSAPIGVALLRTSTPGAEVRPSRCMGAIELAYSWVLQRSPDARFGGPGVGRTRLSSQTLAQADILSSLLIERERFRRSLGDSQHARVKPWRQAVVTLDQSTSQGGNGGQVLARVRSQEGQALQGNLSFSQGEHLGCMAALAADGRGRCTLFDSHGHAEHHDEENAVLMVTCGGQLAGESVYPPFALLFAPGKKVHSHAGGTGPRHPPPAAR